MEDSIKVVFGYGATEGKTEWKRLGRLHNPSLERGIEGVRPFGLAFAEGAVSYPFAFTVMLNVRPEEREDETLATKADAKFLEHLPGHSLIS